MTGPSPADRARALIEHQLTVLGELRNASARDAGFKAWRQNTLTVIQRVWPDEPTRAERFRRVPFSAPSSKMSAVVMRSYFEKGCAEAITLLRAYLADAGSTTMVDGDAADDGNGFDPGTAEDDFPVVELTGKSVPAGEPDDPTMGEGVSIIDLGGEPLPAPEFEEPPPGAGIPQLPKPVPPPPPVAKKAPPKTSGHGKSAKSAPPATPPPAKPAAPPAAARPAKGSTPMPPAEPPTPTPPVKAAPAPAAKPAPPPAKAPDPTPAAKSAPASAAKPAPPPAKAPDPTPPAKSAPASAAKPAPPPATVRPAKGAAPAQPRIVPAPRPAAPPPEARATRRPERPADPPAAAGGHDAHRALDAAIDAMGANPRPVSRPSRAGRDDVEREPSREMSRPERGDAEREPSREMPRPVRDDAAREPSREMPRPERGDAERERPRATQETGNTPRNARHVPPGQAELKDMLGFGHLEDDEQPAYEDVDAVVPEATDAAPGTPLMPIEPEIVEIDIDEDPFAPPDEEERVDAESAPSPSGSLPAGVGGSAQPVWPPGRFDPAPDETVEETSDPDAGESNEAMQEFLRSSPVLGASAHPLRRPARPKNALHSPAAASLTALASEVAHLGVPEGQRAAARAQLLELARCFEEQTLSWDSLRGAVTFVMEYPPLARRVIPMLIPYLDLAA
ncbi:MAG: hypothetical protein ACHQ52_09740 [Candidatus Eisenbacteria bacterium]